jgi:myo-inositol-1(or 4)-monophosphatase
VTELDPQELLVAAEEGARAAGAIIAEKFQRPPNIEHKGVIDLVTDADKASEAMLVEFIRAEFPTHGILAEEGGSRKGEDYRWLIDPLDGTTNYAHRLPHFAVSVAVEGPSGLLAGVVFDPIKGEMFAAAKGHGATLNGQPIHVSATNSLQASLLASGFPYDVKERPEPALSLFSHFLRQTQGVRRYGAAALDLAYVAAGRFDGFFEAKLNPWDIGAGALIVTEAGGKVSDLDGSELKMASGNIIAGNAKVHGAIVEGCKTVIASLPAQ